MQVQQTAPKIEKPQEEPEAPEAPPKRELRLRDKVFLGAAGLMLLIIGPYVYYASVVY